MTKLPGRGWEHGGGGEVGIREDGKRREKATRSQTRSHTAIHGIKSKERYIE